MRGKKFFIFTLILILSVFRISASEANVEQIQNGVYVEVCELNLEVRFYADDVVRVVKWLAGASAEKSSLIVKRDNLPDLELKFKENGKEVVLSSSKITINISKKDGKIEYFTSGDKSIFKEEGNVSITPVEYGHERSFNIQQNFLLTPEEGIYGLGQHQYGYVNYRGRKVVLVQTNIDAVIPFFISKALNDEDIHVFGRDKILDFTFIEDSVQGVVRCLELFESARNEVYNLATQKGNSIEYVARKIIEKTGSKSNLYFESNRPGEVCRFIADISKARAVLGYQPQNSIDQGIEKSIEWYTPRIENYRKAIRAQAQSASSDSTGSFRIAPLSPSMSKKPLVQTISPDSINTIK